MRWDWLKFLTSLGNGLINTLWPLACLKCRTLIKESAGLCADCWGQIRWIGQNRCARCGYPLDISSQTIELLCGPCFQTPPLFYRGRSVFVYDDVSKPLILGLKHLDRTHTAPVFGAWMARLWEENSSTSLPEEAWIVPVPLHWTRLIKRSYNQAALLGIALARHLKRPQHDVLRRVRRTPAQGTQTRTQRQKNVHGAFAIKSSYKSRVKGRHVVLVDDVWTTGATLQACTRVLKTGGASKIDILTLARVAREL